jgi:hypothetical protein
MHSAFFLKISKKGIDFTWCTNEEAKMKHFAKLMLISVCIIALGFAVGCCVDVTAPGDDDDGGKEIKPLPTDWPPDPSPNSNTPYYGDYTTIPGGTPEDYGFTGDYGESANDHFAITPEGYIDTNPSPGGWYSAMFTPDVGLFDRTLDNGVVIEWQVMYPSTNYGFYREMNKLYIALVDENDNLLYRFLYRPLTLAYEQETVDMELKNGEILLAEVRTRQLVPSGASADWIRFKVELTPTDIRIYMDHDGSGFVKYIDIYDDTYTQFRKLHFQYRTGEYFNYHMLVDDLSIYPID